MNFSRPFPEEALEEAFSPGRACRDVKSIEPASHDGVVEIGSSLFKAIFADEILVSWRLRVARAQEAGRALRLCLHLDSPDLWDWPWEFLHDPARGFLDPMLANPIVRYLEMPEHVRPLRVRPPIRVLVVTAHPKDLSPLAVEDELDQLKDELAFLEAANWLKLDYLEGATQASLRQKLDQHDFHILHFIGHGSFDTKDGGSILLEDENGKSDPLRAQKFSTLLALHRELRLVVLNVCHGAKANVADPHSSLAQSLVRGRMPAVVAMRTAISDKAAILFSKIFYQSLARREPIDLAVSKARSAMFGESPEWGSPVLVTRSRDCKIFDITRWEVLKKAVEQMSVTWRSAIGMGVVLIALAWFGRYYGMRWIDPNPYWKLHNPSDCPSPKNVAIAFVKVEPPGKAPFCMSRLEITQHQWRKIVGRPPTRRKGGGLPVVRISWNDTRRFLGRLNRLDPDGHYRLPTGAEWEYAAKGGEDNPPASSDIANCSNKEDPDGFEDTAPVGSYQPNLLGLYDMLGNASEWVSDSAIPGKKIRRGGGFANALKNCSVTYESVLAPDRQPNDAGFRIVREPVKL